MSTRWLHELAVPGWPDISSVYASYILAATLAIALILGGLWDALAIPCWAAAILSLGLQIPLLIGVLIGKIRTSLPPPTGHFKMFEEPEGLANVGWLRALAGFATSAVVLIAWFLANGG